MQRKQVGRLSVSVTLGIALLALGLLGLGLFRAPAGVRAEVVLNSLTDTYTQTFDMLGNGVLTTYTTLPAGWTLFEAGTSARVNQAYAADTGGSNTGDTYSYGASGSTERALGSLLSGSISSTLGVSFTNKTGVLVSGLVITYTCEQWRLGATGRYDRLDFQYSTDAISLTSGNWSDVDALDCTGVLSTGTVGATNGNTYRATVSALISGLNIAPDQTFWLRWTDFNATSNDDGLAIDDFYLTPYAAIALTLTKSVTPATTVAYHGNVTYTLVLRNTGGLTETAAFLTDTLPAAVDFASWVEQNGATVTGDEITWNGELAPTSAITFTFVATHNGDYGDVVTNTARFSGTAQAGTAEAVFSVEENLADVTLVYHDLEDVVHSGEILSVTGPLVGGWGTSVQLLPDAGAEVFSTTLTGLPVGNGYEYKYVVNDGTNDQWDWLNTANRVYTVTGSTTHDDYRNVVVGWAKLQWPPATQVDLGTATERVYGRLFVSGVTTGTGAGRGLQAAVGYGTGDDPAAWTWFPMVYNTDDGISNDEFMGAMTPTAGGVYSYAVRFDGNWGTGNPYAGWTYGDLDGVVPGGDPFELDQTGVLTVHIGPRLEITKTVEPFNNVPRPGVVTYTVVVANTGDRTASGVRLTDTLPTVADFDSWVVSPTQTSVVADEITWAGDLAAGETLTWTFTAAVSGTAGSTVINTATVGYAGNEQSNSAAFVFAYASTPVIINELDADTLGFDVAEFIELYDGGVGNTALDGLVMVFFNGSNDLSYHAIDLDGYSTNANGYFVLGNLDVPGVVVTFSTNLLQNGADAVALYWGNATDFPTNTPVTTTNLVDALVYDTDDDDDAGLLILLNAGQPQINENSNGKGDQQSNQRCPNGSGGPRNTSTYQQLLPTPNAANVCATQYDAAIAKTGPVTITPGAEIAYTIIYSNTGASALSNVRITDTLPAGFGYVSDTSGLTRTGTAWEVGELPAGALRSFVLTVTVAPTASGRLTNTVVVAAAVDEVAANNTARHGSDVVILADYDLVLTKSAAPAEVYLHTGESARVTYTLRVDNFSTVSDTTRFTVSDVLPEGFVYVSDDSGIAPNGTGADDDPLVWAFTTPLTHGNSLTFQVVVSATDAILLSGRCTNTAMVVAEPADQYTVNNTGAAGVMVWRLISLAQARTLPSGAPVYVGGYVNFPPGLLHNATQTRDEFMIQDAAQGSSGLAVYYTGSLSKFPPLPVGTGVRVLGTLGQFNGKLQINVLTTTQVMTTGEVLTLVPVERATAEITETVEGVLVTVQGTVVSISGLHMYVNDGSGQVDIFRDTDIANVNFNDFEAGDRVKVSGVGTQYDTTAPYDSGYEIAVRFQSDLQEYPRVLNVGPADGATNVVVGANVTATFNLTVTNISTSTFLLHGPSGAVEGGVSWDAAARTATFDPAAALAYNTRYTATLKAELGAENGLTLTQDYVWSFTTQPQPCTPVTEVDFSWTPVKPMVGEEVTFSAVITPATATQPNYAWAFGDGGSSTQVAPMHTFPLTHTAQTYTVILTVTNSCSVAITRSHVLTVSPRQIFLPLVLRNHQP